MRLSLLGLVGWFVGWLVCCLLGLLVGGVSWWGVVGWGAVRWGGVWLLVTFVVWVGGLVW